jgi:hypothetical protein
MSSAWRSEGDDAIATSERNRTGFYRKARAPVNPAPISIMNMFPT